MANSNVLAGTFTAILYRSVSVPHVLDEDPFQSEVVGFFNTAYLSFLREALSVYSRLHVFQSLRSHFVFHVKIS